MRRALVMFALMAIPVTACGSTTTPAAQPTGSVASLASGAASSTEATTAAAPESTDVNAPPSGSTKPSLTSNSTATADSVPPGDSTAAELPLGSAAGVTITTADTEFGRVLFDGTGQAIYLFDRETTTTPDCYDDCAVAWPPVLTDGPAVGADGTMTDLLGTTPRADGSTQVTYAGHPLYYYAHEGKNEVTCHDVTEFGGVWLAVAPTGQAAA